MFFSFRSSMTLSIQIFLCLPLLIFPSRRPCKTTIGSLFPFIRSTCSNHRSLPFWSFLLLFHEPQALPLFFHFWLFLFYSGLWFSSANSSPPPVVFSRPSFSGTNITSRTATRAVLTGRNRVASLFWWRCVSLFTFLRVPECCTCQTYSPFDVLFTSYILRYQPS